MLPMENADKHKLVVKRLQLYGKTMLVQQLESCCFLLFLFFWLKRLRLCGPMCYIYYICFFFLFLIDKKTQLCSHPCSGSPLFLQTALSELCTIGFFQKFQEQLDTLMACSNLDELFQLVIQRLEVEEREKEEIGREGVLQSKLFLMQFRKASTCGLPKRFCC
jgi:hypothetical protein